MDGGFGTECGDVLFEERVHLVPSTGVVERGEEGVGDVHELVWSGVVAGQRVGAPRQLETIAVAGAQVDEVDGRGA